MKTLLLFISLFIIAADAATVRLYFTDPLTNEKDTNAFYITPVGTNVLSNGGVVGRGVTTRYVPASDGYRTNTLAVGHYSITNRSLGSGVVIRVPESSSLYDYTNLLVSGYNIFVTVTNGSGGGTSGALTNNDTRAVTFVDQLTIGTAGGFSGDLILHDGASSSLNIDYGSGTLNVPAPIAATGFAGDGASLTDLAGDEITTGTVADARIASTLTRDTELTAANTVVSNGVVTGLAAGSYAIEFPHSDSASAWVSKAGSDSTGEVGHQEKPFLTVSNAVYALKSSLGSSTSGGTVYVDAGLFGEVWVNLQRTNLQAISLVGKCAATWLTAAGAHALTNHGALITPGHGTRIVGVCVSNDINASVKQAAVGYDLTRASALGTTFVVPTNVYINVPIGIGSSDVGYFIDNDAGDASIWFDGCDWVSKWDCLFVSSLSTEMNIRVTDSSIKVIQPSDYSFPGGGNEGRARAVFISGGYASFENSTVWAEGSTATSNECSGLSFFGATYGYTNIGTRVFAGNSGLATPVTELVSEPTQFFGRFTPNIITTNDAFVGSIPVATTSKTAKQTLDGSTLTNLNAANITGTFSSITNSGKYNGIKVYRALIAQTGSSAPSATVLENSLGFTPGYGRFAPGLYEITSSSGFTSGKTFVRINHSNAGEFSNVCFEYAGASQIIIRAVDDVQIGALADDVLTSGSNVEILIYP